MDVDVAEVFQWGLVSEQVLVASASEPGDEAVALGRWRVARDEAAF